MSAASQWITAVGCAKVAIIAIQRRAWLAIVYRIAGFGTVADVVVVAVAIIGCIQTVIDARVAGVVGTGDTIIANWRDAGYAIAGGGVTGFGTITEQAIITISINCALGRCAVWISPVGEAVPVVVEAHAIREELLLRPVTGV